MREKIKTKKLISKLIILFLVFIFSFSACLDKAGAYTLEAPSDSLKSIFSKNPFQLSPIDLNKFMPTDRFGLTFADLTDTKSFSFQDIGASIKAITTLFIKLMITSLNVTLGIFKVLLEILTNR